MIELLNVDCMEYMKTVPDKFFDLAIVDPPYREENQPDQWMRAKGGKMDNFGALPDELYFKELSRTCKEFICWGGNYFANLLEPNNNWIIWYKMNDGVHFSMAEMAYCTIRLNVKVFHHLYNGAPDKIHPTQKPVKLYKWLLENYGTCKKCRNTGVIWEDVVGDGGTRMQVDCEWCDVAETGNPKIFDSHGGSMSIAIACHDMKFDLTLCEIDKDYYDAGVKRYENHKKQLTIF